MCKLMSVMFFNRPINRLTSLLATGSGRQSTALHRPRDCYYLLSKASWSSLGTGELVVANAHNVILC